MLKRLERKWSLMNKHKVHFSQITDDWRTPQKLYEELDKEFNFDFDPCPFQSTFNGLEIEWGKSNFVNPPYSQLKLWCKKAFQEREREEKHQLC